MPSKAQKKNAWRARRREAIRNGTEAKPCIVKHDVTAESVQFSKSVGRNELIEWALAVIQYYCMLWEFAKASPLMTTHKQKIFKDLFTSHDICTKGIFDKWTKANGHFCYNIRGYYKNSWFAHGLLKETSMVKYDFCDETHGRHVLTMSGSLYILHDHCTKGTPEEFSIAQEKRSDLIKFRVVHGPSPRRPC